jgi:hypothetical protein
MGGGVGLFKQEARKGGNQEGSSEKTERRKPV